jgi:hypothetical protein
LWRKNPSHHNQTAEKTKPQPRKQPKTQTKKCAIANPHTHAENPSDKATEANNLITPKQIIALTAKKIDVLLNKGYIFTTPSFTVSFHLFLSPKYNAVYCKSK